MAKLKEEIGFRTHPTQEVMLECARRVLRKRGVSEDQLEAAAARFVASPSRVKLPTMEELERDEILGD